MAEELVTAKQGQHPGNAESVRVGTGKRPGRRLKLGGNCILGCWGLVWGEIVFWADGGLVCWAVGWGLAQGVTPRSPRMAAPSSGTGTELPLTLPGGLCCPSGHGEHSGVTL